MKVKSLTLIVTAAALLTLTACKSDNPPLTGPAAQPPAKLDRPIVQTNANGVTVQVDSRVDILFVIDDSNSMRNHQQKLSTNMSRFVDEIAKVKAIDFHIGYTVVHDSTRYGVEVERECGGKLNWEDPGTLKTLKDSTGVLAREGRRYVKSTDDFKKILKENLDPGKVGESYNPGINPDLVKPFVKKSPTQPCASGPEEEELFTPLLGAIDNPVVVKGPNKGFRRAGALFVAILVSDAKDQSGISVDDVLRRVEEGVGSAQSFKRPRIFTVGIKPGTKYGSGVEGCKPDPVWPRPSRVNTVGQNDNPLVNLARLTQDSEEESHVLSICDNNYGEALAKFGTKIKQEALRDIVVPLGSYTEITDEQKKQLQVTLGDQPLIKGEAEAGGQWNHDVQNETVVIYAQNIDWTKFANAKIQIVFTPAGTGLTTKPIGQASR